MATLDDVAKNQDIVEIANAIRRVTRTDSPMTIPEMPERLLDIRVLEKSLKTVNFNAQGPVSLGTYDTQLKHMFIVMPKENTDVANLAKAEPEIDLKYDNETGELKVAHNEVVNVDVKLYVLDLLLPEDDSTAGVLMWSDTGIDTVSQFTNAIAGVIKGAARDGYVYAEPDGTGSVHGWDALSAKVTITDEDFDEIYGD